MKNGDAIFWKTLEGNLSDEVNRWIYLDHMVCKWHGDPSGKTKMVILRPAAHGASTRQIRRYVTRLESDSFLISETPPDMETLPKPSPICMIVPPPPDLPENEPPVPVPANQIANPPDQNLAHGDPAGPPINLVIPQNPPAENIPEDPDTQHLPRNF